MSPIFFRPHTTFVLDGREHLFRVKVGVPDVFAYQAQPSINEQLVRGLMRGEYIDKRENILLIGNSGTGKIHLACALAFAACAMGRKVRFYTVTGLVTELLFDIVGRAYEHQSLIVTSNLPFEEWTEIFGSERLTGNDGNIESKIF